MTVSLARTPRKAWLASLKIRLPRLSLAPSWVVAVGADNTQHGYRLKLRWNGKYELQPAAIPPTRPCILIVEHTVPYRRKLQQFPAAASSRLALLRTAPDEFPLPAGEMLFGMGVHGSDGYIYALPREYITRLRESGIQPALILVADTIAAEGIFGALEGYFRHGAALDLLETRRLFPPHSLRHIQLGAGLIFLLLVSGALLNKPDMLNNILEWRVKSLREQAGTLPKINSITEKMAQAQAEASRLYAGKDARLAPLLTKLFDSLPPGYSLRSIEYKNGMLKISGRGGSEKTWLIEQGFPTENITIENFGGYQRFKAERPI